MVKINNNKTNTLVKLDFTYLTACGMTSAKQNFLFPCKVQGNAISNGILMVEKLHNLAHTVESFLFVVVNVCG